MIKRVLLIEYGSGCMCNSKVLFWCVWCAGVSGVLVGKDENQQYKSLLLF
jgi:hypothetical protein